MKVQQIERKFSWLLTLGALMLLAVAVFAANGARPAQALGGSVNVAIVGSPNCMFEGEQQTTGGAFNSFSFTNVLPGSITTATLAPFDTVLLNVCSPQMHCDPDTLTGAAKTALGTFVGNGGKLIIYDSECVGGQLGHPANYAWLPFPFTTTFTSVDIQGTLIIAEQNILSTSPPLSPYYIDAASMSLNSEVGDANFMSTLDPNWCVDMSGIRANGETGPVHAYARYQSGLMIYNGLDLDTTESGEATPPAPNGLQKIWLQELQVPLSPTFAELPCGVPVVPGEPVGSVTICKHTDPPGGSGFTFRWNFPADRTLPFTLDDNECLPFPLAVVYSPYNFVESALPPGWTLTNIVCTGGANVLIGSDSMFDPGDTAVHINLGPGENIICTFTNTLAPCGGPNGLNISTGSHVAFIQTTNSDFIWTVSSPPGPAHLITPASSWVLPDPNHDPDPSFPAHWIDANGTSGNTSDPQGDYVYDTSFFVPAGSPILLDIWYAADDSVKFTLTDPSTNDIPLPPAFTSPTPYAFRSIDGAPYHAIYVGTAPTSGTYALHARVTNLPPIGPNPTGLLVQGTIRCAPPVGGLVALSVSDSGSPIPSLPLAATATSVMAALAAGGWYGRRRWLD